MKVLILIATLAFCGCNARVQASKPNPAREVASETAIPAATPDPTPEWSDKQKIAALRIEAHKRGLRWRVTCSDELDDPQRAFFAMAEPRKVPDGAVYVEEGALPWWAAWGSSQADAAYQLYASIQQTPTNYPDHREPEHHHKKMCPPELRGD